MPDMPDQFQVKTHPDTAAIIAETDEWASHFVRRFYPGEHYATDRGDELIAEYGCLCGPELDRENALLNAKLMVWITAFDDQLTNRRGLGASQVAANGFVQAFMREVVGWGCPGDDLPFSEDWDRLRQQMSPDQWNRFVATLEAGLVAQLVDAEVIWSRRARARSLEEYLAVGRHSISMEWLFPLDESVVTPRLPTEVIERKELVDLRNAAMDFVRLVNDFYSYRKESAAKEVVNSVELLQRIEGLDFEGATDRLRGIILDREQDFLRRRDTILTGDLAQQPGIGDYVRQVEHWYPGNRYWHPISARYMVGQGPVPER
jgi:germacradienol/geosmin synthase